MQCDTAQRAAKELHKVTVLHFRVCAIAIIFATSCKLHMNYKSENVSYTQTKLLRAKLGIEEQ